MLWKSQVESTTILLYIPQSGLCGLPITPVGWRILQKKYQIGNEVVEEIPAFDGPMLENLEDFE